MGIVGGTGGAGGKRVKGRISKGEFPVLLAGFLHLRDTS